MAEPIRATLSESVDYYLEAYENNPKRGTSWLLIVIGVILVMGIVFTLESRPAIRKGDQRWWVAPLIGVSAMALAFIYIGPTGQRWQLKRQLKKMVKNPPTQAWFEFGEDGFISTGDGGRTSFHPWGTVPTAVERLTGVVIYTDKDIYFWVPIKAFSVAGSYPTLLKRLEAKVKDFRPLKT